MYLAAFAAFGVDKSMIGNTFLKKIRWKCILEEFVVLWGAAGDEQHNKFGARLHYRQKVSKYCVWTSVFKTTFWNIIWNFIVFCKLLSAVFKAKHSHFTVKSLFIKSVLTFHLTIVSWGCHLYSVVLNSTLF